MEVSIEVAFHEACQALGEAIVRERLLGKEKLRLEQQLATSTESPPPGEGVGPKD